MRKIIYLILLIFCVSNIYAQKRDNSIPESIKLGLNDNNTLISTKKSLPALNLTALAVQDQQDEQNGLPPRFGYPVDANYSLTNSGIWKDLSNGDRIWRLEINCNDAISINLLYDKFWLPVGAKLHLYTKDKSQIIGGFSYLNNKGTKENPSKFTTGLLFSETIILELYEPLSVQNQSILSVDKVVHGYREIAMKNLVDNKDYGESGPCQVNVNCSEGQNWQNEKKGVAMILVNGTRWCSGSLINNTSNNQTPYFLTADHCIGSLDANGDTDASYYSFWWNYESSTCSQNSADFVPSSTSGATLIANNSTSDFALFELTESPLDNNIDVYFNGWDKTNSVAQSGIGIHHPSGDFKKISFENNTLSSTSYNSNSVSANASHWRVANWDKGVTEGGSSGSPLFNSNKRIIGQLHGGSAGCNGNIDNGLPDWYGKLWYSWDGASPQRRLKDWLDPLNTNQDFIDGIEAVSFQNDINLLCYDNSKTIQLSNNQNNSVTWQVSSNVTILSSSNNSIIVRASFSSSTGNGWIKAILSNGITLQEDFEVGLPNVDLYKVYNASLNGNYTLLNNRVWNHLDIYHDFSLPAYYQNPSPFNYKWDVTATSGMIRANSSGRPRATISPNENHGTIQIGIKAENECGCSPWKWQTFRVNGVNNNSSGGILNPE